MLRKKDHIRHIYLGFQFATIIIAAACIGYYFDTKANLSYVLTIVFACIGFVLAFINLIRQGGK